MARRRDDTEDMTAGRTSRGDDAQRLDMVERARRFKRSWVEMAEGLVRVRRSGAFRRWGYADIYAYAEQELRIRPATTDKLTGSYMALRSHAPAVLRRDGVARPIPNVDSVDYFARALQQRPSNDGRDEDAPGGVIAELKRAVFEEGRPVAVLRRRFNAQLYPKPEGAAQVEAMEKMRSAARRIQNLMQGVEGLSPGRVQQVDTTLERLTRELSALIDAARTRAAS